MTAATKEPDWVEESIKGLPAFLTIKETAELLRMGQRHVYTLAERGQLAVVSKGARHSRRLVPKVSLAKYLRSLENG
jgi:excisionase family DNA binding protein